MGGVAVGLARIKAERAKLVAEARKTDAETNGVTVDTGLAGAKVIKDISEAAAVLVVPYRIENTELRERIEKLEDKVSRLEAENRGKDDELRKERMRFEERTQLLVMEYEAKIQALRRDIE